MVRAPVAGRVKTRLARGVGVAEALHYYRVQSRLTIARLGRQPFWETILSVTPDRDCASRVWPGDIARMAQGGGDLGARMQRPMRILPPGPVCVIGTDIPGITVAHVRRAFASLGRRNVVFGPASDGGFWLVGMRRRPRVSAPYTNVLWSHPQTLANVLANLNLQDVGFTATLHDVDEAVDLDRVRHTLGRLVRSTTAT
jgi:uncharacterized protein